MSRPNLCFNGRTVAVPSRPFPRRSPSPRSPPSIMSSNSRSNSTFTGRLSALANRLRLVPRSDGRSCANGRPPSSCRSSHCDGRSRASGGRPDRPCTPWSTCRAARIRPGPGRQGGSPRGPQAPGAGQPLHPGVGRPEDHRRRMQPRDPRPGTLPTPGRPGHGRGLPGRTDHQLQGFRQGSEPGPAAFHQRRQHPPAPGRLARRAPVLGGRTPGLRLRRGDRLRPPPRTGTEAAGTPGTLRTGARRWTNWNSATTCCGFRPRPGPSRPS